jgi:hypothetical protein
MALQQFYIKANPSIFCCLPSQLRNITGKMQDVPTGSKSFINVYVELVNLNQMKGRAVDLTAHWFVCQVV